MVRVVQIGHGRVISEAFDSETNPFTVLLNASRHHRCSLTLSASCLISESSRGSSDQLLHSVSRLDPREDPAAEKPFNDESVQIASGFFCKKSTFSNPFSIATL